MKTNFYLFTRADKTGEYPIRVSISINGNRLVSTAGVSVSRNAWNADTMCVPDKYVNAKGIKGIDINARLLDIRAKVTKYASSLNGKKPSKEEMASILANVLKRKQRNTASAETTRPKSILDYFDTFMEVEGKANEWTEGTRKGMNAFRIHLEKQGYKSFDDLNDNGLLKFVDYLRNDANNGNGMVESSVRKYFGYLQWFLNSCIRAGYCSESQIGKVKPKFKLIAQPVIFLTNDELDRLYKYEIPEEGAKVKLIDDDGNEYEKTIESRAILEDTRDLFCFCATTSLRYSDMANLKRSNVHGDYIEIVTKKTDDHIKIELNKWSRAILAKYKDVKFPNDAVLPTRANPVMNRALKDLCELCGFNTPIINEYYQAGERVKEVRPKWQCVTTHSARKTFICKALSLGIPPQVVMKWSGHKDYDAMKPYIDIAETIKAENMNIFDNNLK